MASDFGDAPAPYPTLSAGGGAEHMTDSGLSLGAAVDSEADGQPTPAADGDGADEDGVTFGTVRAGQLDAIVIVNVQNAPAGAKLDAWIDFNGDGSWGGPFEQFADRVPVWNGDNVILFDVPSWAAGGETYARFRLSTVGDLAPVGGVADGEVEDHLVTILPPSQASGEFEPPRVITSATDGASSVFAADVDGDGDLDALSASGDDDTIAWYENIDGLGNFGSPRVITTAVGAANSVFAADVDGDGDLDVLSASSRGLDGTIAWYENTDGTGNYGPPQVVTKTAVALSVIAADVDGDGDLDALSASLFGFPAWYENTDGSGNFGPPRVITTAADGASSIFAADVDGDGDLDALSASQLDDQIVWYENWDGAGDFGPPRVITATADGANSVFAADVDGDGDLDALSASSNDDKIAWYENTDGSGNFGAPQVITTAADGASSVFAADVDGDGDLDALSSSSNDDKIAWYENTDSSGNFGPPRVITTVAKGANTVIAADVDGDGDVDALSAGGDKIAWYENTDGSGNFGAPQFITDAADGARSVFAADMDGDGDLDALSASSVDDTIAWYENTDGSGNFGPPQVITTAANGAVSVFAADVDGDGDLDALSASFRDNKIAWYENLAFDFGDAPMTYQGARHDVSGPRLGTARDFDSQGRPSSAADSDDIDETPDDEDGVTVVGSIVRGQTATVQLRVLATGATAQLDAWIDFDGNGIWSSAEQILDNLSLATGDHELSFVVPSSAQLGDTFARFRISDEGNLPPHGVAFSGEVEDHMMKIVGDLEVNLSTDGSADVRLRRHGEDLEFYDAVANIVLASQPLGSTHGVRIVGTSGATDRLTVDYDFGGYFSLPGGVHFDGGTGGADELQVLGTGATVVTVRSSDGLLATAIVDVTEIGDLTSITCTGLESLQVASVLASPIDGPLHVGAGSLTMDAATVIDLGSATILDDGTITAPQGLHLAASETLSGSGVINAPISAGPASTITVSGSINGPMTTERGSTITLTGNLLLGDEFAFDGIVLDGRLNVGSHTLTLRDGHKAVLGSQTSLSGGTILSENGIALEDNRTLVGEGTVGVEDDPTDAEFENQGFVHGTGTGIVFHHLVTGAGDFGGVIEFLGGTEFGNSPAQVDALGDITFGPNNINTVEIGGLIPGREFDQLRVTGNVELGGELTVRKLDLGNDFTFELGQTFEIITFGSRNEDFATYSGLDLGESLRLKPSITADSLVLTVVSHDTEPPRILGVALNSRVRSRNSPGV